MANKKNAFGTLAVGIVLAAIGVIILVMNIMQAVENGKPHAPVSELTSATVKADMLVNGELPFNYGSYAHVNADVSGRYYLTLTSDGYFFSIFCTDTDIMKALEKQSDDYYDYLSGKTAEAPAAVSINGKIKAMDKEDKDLVNKCLKESFDIDILDTSKQTLYYYIEAVSTEVSPVVIVIGAVMTLAGLVLAFVSVIQALKK